MTGFEIALIVCSGVLALSAIGVVLRMIIGPTILDRALATDSLVTLVVMGMALYVASSGASWAGGAMLGLTGMAFIGTVTFARFVAREDAPNPDRPLSRQRTETGVHVAIHPTPTKVAQVAEATDDTWEDGFGAENGVGAEHGSRAFEDESPADGPAPDRPASDGPASDEPTGGAR